MNEVVFGLEHIAVSAIIAVLFGSYVLWKNKGGKDD